MSCTCMIITLVVIQGSSLLSVVPVLNSDYTLTLLPRNIVRGSSFVLSFLLLFSMVIGCLFLFRASFCGLCSRNCCFVSVSGEERTIS
ncbi:hypothetical protein DER44DRAFT_431569 [Fusarium oxysporum]|nr:hypothetical protein DER44DRAFT_431569 [Fusarium oxysporum]